MAAPKPAEQLPFYVWIIPFRGLKRTHRRRRTCEEALAVCRRLGLDEELSGQVVYEVLRALQTGSLAFLNDAQAAEGVRYRQHMIGSATFDFIEDLARLLTALRVPSRETAGMVKDERTDQIGAGV